MASAGQYEIRAVARLTGISIDSLRAWERRYRAVTPQRDGRARMYSDADIARLRLLQRARDAGHSIGRVSQLDDGALRRLVEDSVPQREPLAPASTGPMMDRSRLARALLTLDTAAIDQECWRLAMVLPALTLVRDVLMPTLRDVGDMWHRRAGGIAQEHVISGAIRHLLGSFLRLHVPRESSVRLLFATPAGDRHEIGILAAAMLAATQGLGVSYVGPDVPSREIVEAVKAAQAQVVVLGVTLTQRSSATGRELATIASALPEEVALWVGGPAAGLYATSLRSRALLVGDIDSYHQLLARLASGV